MQQPTLLHRKLKLICAGRGKYHGKLGVIMAYSREALRVVFDIDASQLSVYYRGDLVYSANKSGRKIWQYSPGQWERLADSELVRLMENEISDTSGCFIL